jgi:Ca-activated chloride channel family protein
LGATLLTVANDVKLQVEFNPFHIKEWRLIGYENRRLQDEDFKDDKKDAGEMGAGHMVTALYELVPSNAKSQSGAVGPLKYQGESKPDGSRYAGEAMTVKLRYKQAKESTGIEAEVTAPYRLAAIEASSPDLRFAAAVAEFGMVLRKSQHRGDSSYDQAIKLLTSATGEDPDGRKAELMFLIKTARGIAKRD